MDGNAVTVEKISSLPKYCRQIRPHGKHSAYVELQGHRYHLGPWQSPKSLCRYRELLAEYQAGVLRPPVRGGIENLTVGDLAERFLAHARSYYVKDGAPTTEVGNFEDTLAVLRGLYGSSLAAEFSPKKLRTVQAAFVQKGWSRVTCNKRLGQIKRTFRWATGEELIPATVYPGLCAVDGLRKSRTPAPDPEPIRPVPEAFVEAILPHVSRQVAAMIRVQLACGCRPDEICRMRLADLDMSGPVWVYQPGRHKTQHHGHPRQIFLGPKAQEALGAFLAGRMLTDCLFSPLEAERERLAALHEARMTPAGRGNEPGTNRVPAPMRKPGPHYTTASYRRAIHRGCLAAGVPRWAPNRLRHSAATMIRKAYGIDAAQVILGHQRLETSQIYAEKNVQRAVEIIKVVG